MRGRKPHLTPIVAQFTSAQDQVITDWRTVKDHESVLGVGAVRAASRAALAMSATNWEFFRSEWHKRAIALDTSNFRTWAGERLRQVAEKTVEGRSLAIALQSRNAKVHADLPRRLAVKDVGALLDPLDNNITFRDKKSSDRLAQAQLSPGLAKGPLALTHDDWLVLELMVSIRNALAHASTRSIAPMRQAIKNAAKSGDPKITSLARTERQVTTAGIGKYLSVPITWVPSPQLPQRTEPRIVAIVEHVRDLGPRFDLAP